jgi:hypothetical protein
MNTTQINKYFNFFCVLRILFKFQPDEVYRMRLWQNRILCPIKRECEEQKITSVSHGSAQENIWTQEVFKFVHSQEPDCLYS